jgi:pseudaminic acid synthase
VKDIRLGNKSIGEKQPCYFIAEMSANHTHDKKLALEIVHAAKESKADCIKIQTYTADTLTINCNNEYFKIKGGTWDGNNLYELYQQAYTPWEWHGDIKEEAEKIGLNFFSTPYDKSSVDFLEDLGVEFYKIASFELVDLPLIKYIASKKKPILLSTGMGTLDEIKKAVETIRKENNDDICLLKCSSAYPAAPEDMNLLTIPHMRETFDTCVGLSDHSMGNAAAVAAAVLGAKVIEKHFCISRKYSNPDASFSLEPEEFLRMVNDVREAERALGKVDYSLSEKELLNRNFRKSIFVVKDIAMNQPLTEENIRIIRPGNGLLPEFYDQVLGKKASRDLKTGDPLTTDMIGD